MPRILGPFGAALATHWLWRGGAAYMACWATCHTYHADTPICLYFWAHANLGQMKIVALHGVAGLVFAGKISARRKSSLFPLEKGGGQRPASSFQCPPYITAHQKDLNHTDKDKAIKRWSTWTPPTLPKPRPQVCDVEQLNFIITLSGMVFFFIVLFLLWALKVPDASQDLRGRHSSTWQLWWYIYVYSFLFKKMTKSRLNISDNYVPRRSSISMEEFGLSWETGKSSVFKNEKLSALSKHCRMPINAHTIDSEHFIGCASSGCIGGSWSIFLKHLATTVLQQIEMGQRWTPFPAGKATALELALAKGHLNICKFRRVLSLS